VQTLCRVSRSSKGAQAAMDANVLKWVPKLLESENAEIRMWTSDMLEVLARHEATRRAAVECLLSLLWLVTIRCF
jgi:hypothetical protein